MRLGRTKGVHGPGGTVLVLPWVDKATSVDLRVSSLELPIIQSLTADHGMIELVATVFPNKYDVPGLIKACVDFPKAKLSNVFDALVHARFLGKEVVGKL
uniref:PHB domain-containing protein n=1 Tax=Globodera pallida TaxID=36090 RepID=A0A183BTX6_GLOPA